MLTINSQENLNDILQVAKQNNVPEVVLFGMFSDPNTTRLFPLFDAMPIGKVGTVYVDVDGTPDIAMKYSIRIVPVVFVFKNGYVVQATKGELIKTEDDLKKFIEASYGQVF